VTAYPYALQAFVASLGHYGGYLILLLFSHPGAFLAAAIEIAIMLELGPQPSIRSATRTVIPSQKLRCSSLITCL
jgi:glucokinase